MRAHRSIGSLMTLDYANLAIPAMELTVISFGRFVVWVLHPGVLPSSQGPHGRRCGDREGVSC